MSTFTKYSLNKLEIKNELSNFGEQAKKNLKFRFRGVKHQNQKFRIWPPHEENHSYTTDKRANVS